MKSATVKTASALFGAAVLATAGVATLAPAFVAEASADATEGTVEVAQVEGEFAFSQDVVSPNSSISGVFMKAAAAVCASMPNYCAVCGGLIDVDGQFDATVADMADEEGTQSNVLGCSCASNVAGGGAAVNAEVSGVSLASVYALASK